MIAHLRIPFVIAFFFLLCFPGCVSPISHQMRKEARKDLHLPTVLRNPPAYLGSTVIWGGIVIWAQGRSGTGEITVLETPLRYPGYPKPAAESRGRFMARISTAFDPAIYDRGTLITVAGVIIGLETKPLGETQYVYPVLGVKELHVWRRDIPSAYPYDFFWVDPFHPPQPPFWIYTGDP